MPSTAHPDAFHFDRPVPSYWEATARPLDVDTAPLSGSASCDVAVIGAGFTGLTAALRLREEYGIDVRVLDAAEPGWGASGRNGGFVSSGSTKLSWQQLIKTFGLDDTRRWHALQQETIATVKGFCRRFGIEASLDSSGEVCLAHKPSRMQEFVEEAEFYRDVLGEQLTILSRDELRERGLHGERFYGGIRGERGASIHPLNYVRGLAMAAAGNSVRIHGRSRVVRWEETAAGHLLTTDDGALLTARIVLVATNGFTPEEVSRYHAGRILPVLSSILVTRPLTIEERQRAGWTTRQMAYDSRQLLHYFRLLEDGRFLFGGRGGVDSSNWSLEALEQRLRRSFESLFPAWAGVEHTHFWRGLACLSHDLVPYVGPLDERKTVWTALAYHGNGVAMGSWCGGAVAHMIAGRPERANAPSVLTRRLSRFPLPGLRPAYLRGAYIWFEIADRLL